ncbi:hypothetical protein B1813_19620 [Saccharomonospora piscinae]|uniref:Uncharacterized protein n=1 Tax=Saccharomonospora piscinae TaxID=687388 RepID=A0A1V8ZYN0_SACPI|nr:hypothetical protein [Saccharomonospora piscinae]OQO90035.1 hypothetical protein B1813_19620 [Saccharomonospora piscinae]TLW90863.1 hypothetical protein FFT09_16370 [Saccharomonospora piscinae]
MIARDRELLARLAAVNRDLGRVALRLMEAQDGGELPADGLREVGDALRALGGDMIARATELDGTLHPTARCAVFCALCSTEPVARPDQPHDTVDGRFCGNCIAQCLDDAGRRHWCPVDALGKTDRFDTVIEETRRA